MAKKKDGMWTVAKEMTGKEKRAFGFLISEKAYWIKTSEKSKNLHPFVSFCIKGKNRTEQILGKLGMAAKI